MHADIPFEHLVECIFHPVEALARLSKCADLANQIDDFLWFVCVRLLRCFFLRISRLRILTGCLLRLAAFLFCAAARKNGHQHQQAQQHCDPLFHVFPPFIFGQISMALYELIMNERHAFVHFAIKPFHMDFKPYARLYLVQTA